MTLLLPILLLCATLGIAPALPCASMTSYVNSGGWTAFHNICTAANTCFFLPLCEDGFYRPAAEFGFCKGGEIMRQPECRTPCHAGDKSDRFSASSAAWHMLFPLYPQRTTDSDSCHFVPVCKDSGADAVTGVSSDGVFTVEPQCSPAPSPAPSPSPTPSPNADCTNDDSWEGFAFGNTMYSCSSFDPADRFPSSCLELIRHVGDPLEDDLREHCPKACDPALCPFSVDGYATAGDLVQILPSTSHIEGYGGVCECGDLFGEKTRYEVGSILWSNGPQQVMCYGGTVISSFTENSQSRANKRVICQFHEIPAEIQVTSSNVCYLDSPTSAQYPSTVNLRNASLAGNDLPPAFAWSSPYYQFAYFTNTWHHDCAGHEVFGGVLGSPTVEGAANTKDLDLFYQCQRGQPVAAGKVVPDSGVFGKYRIERKQCSDLHDDTASTDLLKNLREQYQPSDCGDCGPRGMVNFMVLSATLHCTMTGDDLIVDANGESYTCVGDGGEGWRNGFGSTHKGNGVEMVVCTDKHGSLPNAADSYGQLMADYADGNSAFDVDYSSYAEPPLPIYNSQIPGCIGTNFNSMEAHLTDVGLGTIPAHEYKDLIRPSVREQSASRYFEGNTCSMLYGRDKGDASMTVTMQQGSIRELATNREIQLLCCKGLFT